MNDKLSLIIEERKTVWLVLTNTDRTEGKGVPCIKAVCDSPQTAKRVGKGGGIQGSDCSFGPRDAYKVYGTWYIPGDIIPSSAVLADSPSCMEWLLPALAYWL